MAVNIFTLLEKSEKAMAGVNPKVKALGLELVKQAYHNGIYVQVTSGFRSFAEQTKLYNQGRFGNAGNIVTNAKAGQSIHNYGLAIDYALANEKGVVHWNLNQDMNENEAKDWFEVAAIGKRLGFAWGGDWKSFKDYPHLDFQKGYSLSSLAKGSRPSIPNVPKRSYMGLGDDGKDIMDMQKDLNKAGFKCDSDGYFGEGTEKAVKAFQKKHGLVSDGFFGAGSAAKLKSVLSAPAKEPAKPAAKPKPPVKEPVKQEEPKMNKEEQAAFDELVANGYVSKNQDPFEKVEFRQVALMINTLRNNLLVLINDEEARKERLEKLESNKK